MYIYNYTLPFCGSRVINYSLHKGALIMKGKGNISEKQARQLKNNQYKQDALTFLIKHSMHCNLFNVTTEEQGNKLIAIYYCKRCRESKTFYYNQD